MNTRKKLAYIKERICTGETNWENIIHYQPHNVIIIHATIISASRFKLCNEVRANVITTAALKVPQTRSRVYWSFKMYTSFEYANVV